MSVQIILNGEERSVAPRLTVAQLLAQLDLVGHRVAVEINREIIPRSRYGEHVLQENDRIEVVRAIGGGQTS